MIRGRPRLDTGCICSRSRNRGRVSTPYSLAAASLEFFSVDWWTALFKLERSVKILSFPCRRHRCSCSTRLGRGAARAHALPVHQCLVHPNKNNKGQSRIKAGAVQRPGPKPGINKQRPRPVFKDIQYSGLLSFHKCSTEDESPLCMSTVHTGSLVAQVTNERDLPGEQHK